MAKKIKKIHVIINPASGRIEPILPVINMVMNEAKIDWDVFVTKKPHDASQLAKQAVEAKVDAVAVYGGDGTVMEAMSGMIGSETPLAILPGGTANVIATELKISRDLKEACQLICAEHHIKSIDVGQFILLRSSKGSNLELRSNDSSRSRILLRSTSRSIANAKKNNKSYFMLRLGLGFEADMMKEADRAIKNRFGRLAYVISSAKALQKIQEAKYQLTIDGKQYESSGFTCIIANSGNTGFEDLSLDNRIDVSDGLLDVIIVRQVNISLFGHILAAILRKRRGDNVELVQHWQGKDIQVISTPQQRAQCDGEVLDKIPLHAKVIPNAGRVIVPVEKDPE